MSTTVDKSITIDGKTIYYIKEFDKTNGGTTYKITDGNGNGNPITTLKDSNGIEYNFEYPIIFNDNKSYTPAVITSVVAPVPSNNSSTSTPVSPTVTLNQPGSALNKSIVPKPVIDDIETKLNEINLETDYVKILTEIQDLTNEKKFENKELDQLNTYNSLLNDLKTKYNDTTSDDYQFFDVDQNQTINNALTNLIDMIMKKIEIIELKNLIDKATAKNSTEGGSKNSKKSKNNKKSKRKYNKNRNMTFKNSPKN